MAMESQGAAELPSLIFALVGKTGHGKSSTANSLSASEKFLANDDFDSVTSEVGSLVYTDVNGQQFLCLDTPGVFDTKLTVSELAARISKFTLQAPDGLDALACVIRKGRMTEEELVSIAQMEKIFGADVWEHAIVVFTHCKDTLDKLKADLAKLGDDHVLNKIILKANNRVGKIDNMTRNPRQLQDDVDHIHLLLAQVPKDTGKKYDNEAFERAREVRKEVDDKIQQATEKLQDEVKGLHTRYMRGQLSQEAYEKKVADLEREHKAFEEKRKEMEMQQAQESFETWSKVKEYACYTGMAVVGLGAAALAAPYLAPVAAFGGFGYALGKSAEMHAESKKAETAGALRDQAKFETERLREERLRDERQEKQRAEVCHIQ
ncbi:unnamed protein product [Effrenium voratum]|uniref:AIG1-type G domain-containing protein n=1 Tax=Effrenium voratum TaxID=2562239 RepID=A0AA36J9T7_9DINO|nr:unnamed protein product [Effrenium voratum]CAJ1427097.1 unnamed protein product [Effrenium voratum]